jgi:hypothetical protein
MSNAHFTEQHQLSLFSTSLIETFFPANTKLLTLSMLPKAVLTATTAMVAWSPLAMAAPRIVEARSGSELSLTAQLRLADT